MKLEQFSAVFLAAGALTAGFIGCGDDETNGGGGSGAATTTTPTTTNPVTSTTTTSGGGDAFLAIACTENGDCGDQGRCILPTDNDSRLGGGAPNGYCTRSCTVNADCGGGGSYCLKDAAGDGACLLGCNQGEPELEFLNSPLDGDKCRGREDLRCTLVEQVAVCVPTCGVDAQCPGRACDPRTAVCVDVPNTGLPNGSECSVQGGTDPCAGVCIDFSIVSLCTSYCVAGGQDLEVDCGGLTNGLCSYRAIDPTGTGDIGLCAKACLAHDQCANPYTWCYPVGGLTGDVVPNGYCYSGAAECTDQGDCLSGEECKDTPHGRYCVESMFPLSLDGTGGGGGAGGGGTGGAGGGGTGGSGGAGGN